MAPQFPLMPSVAADVPRSKGRLLSVAAAAVGCYFAAARAPSFIPASPPSVRGSSGHAMAQSAFPDPVMASIESTAAAKPTGMWLFAGATLAVGSAVRRCCQASSARSAKQEVQEGKPEEKEVEAKEAKESFDVFKPDTYGNITMDDVKKYGAAGTLSYVITELVFWAIAFPTECIVYLNTAGHWPDFSKPEESAAVFGLVFAASNIARLLLPLRFGAALAMAPWVDENIVKRFGGEKATEGA